MGSWDGTAGRWDGNKAERGPTREIPVPAQAPDPRPSAYAQLRCRSPLLASWLSAPTEHGPVYSFRNLRSIPSKNTDYCSLYHWYQSHDQSQQSADSTPVSLTQQSADIVHTGVTRTRAVMSSTLGSGLCPCGIGTSVFVTCKSRLRSGRSRFGAEIARDERISSELLVFEMEATSLLELPKRALKVPAAQGDPLRGSFSTCALSR